MKVKSKSINELLECNCEWMVPFVRCFPSLVVRAVRAIEYENRNKGKRRKMAKTIEESAKRGIATSILMPW